MVLQNTSETILHHRSSFDCLLEDTCLAYMYFAETGFLSKESEEFCLSAHVVVFLPMTKQCLDGCNSLRKVQEASQSYIQT